MRNRRFLKSSILYKRIDVNPPKRKYQAPSVSPHRENWIAHYDIVGPRAVGSMFNGHELVRRTFKVKFLNGQFAVDVGTGSGVKVKFIHGEEHGKDKQSAT